MRAKLLEKADLKLLDALSIARAYEAVRKRQEAMNCSMEPYLADNRKINIVRTRIDKTKLFCYACGKADHFQRDPQCTAKGKICVRCGKIEHYKAQRRSNYSRSRIHDDAHRQNLNYLEEGEEKEVAKKHTVRQKGDIFTVNSPERSV